MVQAKTRYYADSKSSRIYHVVRDWKKYHTVVNDLFILILTLVTAKDNKNYRRLTHWPVE
jgi:hypothetical protein